MLDEEGGDLHVGVHDQLFDGELAVLMLVLPYGGVLDVFAKPLFEIVKCLGLVHDALGEFVVQFGK